MINRSRQSRRPTSSRGFTLIELLVCVAIIGMLSAIAYPAYGKYLLKSRRGTAQVHLMELAQRQNEYMADSRTYADSVTALGVATPAAVSDKYTIAIALTDGPPRGFTITATPVVGSNQAEDGALTIDHTGARTPSSKW